MIFLTPLGNLNVNMSDLPESECQCWMSTANSISLPQKQWSIKLTNYFFHCQTWCHFCRVHKFVYIITLNNFMKASKCLINFNINCDIYTWLPGVCTYVVRVNRMWELENLKNNYWVIDNIQMDKDKYRIE